jgi:hypothetical protein
LIPPPRPDGLIVYEQAHQRGGHATEIALGFTTKINEYAAFRHIETMPVHSQSLKKHATGKGNADKEAMLIAANKRGWHPQDDNACDALWLLDYARKDLRV